MNQRRFQVLTRPPEDKKRCVWNGRRRAGRPAARSPLGEEKARAGPKGHGDHGKADIGDKTEPDRSTFTSASVWHKHSEQARRHLSRGQDSDEDERGWGGSWNAGVRCAGLTGAGSFSHAQRGERARPSAISPARSCGIGGEGTGRRTSPRCHGTSSPGRGPTPSRGHDHTRSRLGTRVLAGGSWQAAGACSQGTCSSKRTAAEHRVQLKHASGPTSRGGGREGDWPGRVDKPSCLRHDNHKWRESSLRMNLHHDPEASALGHAWLSKCGFCGAQACLPACHLQSAGQPLPNLHCVQAVTLLPPPPRRAGAQGAFPPREVPAGVRVQPAGSLQHRSLRRAALRGA